jgi:hypothetical protein
MRGYSSSRLPPFHYLSRSKGGQQLDFSLRYLQKKYAQTKVGTLGYQMGLFRENGTVVQRLNASFHGCSGYDAWYNNIATKRKQMFRI